MRDAYLIKGETITYKKEKYEIGDFYFIPNNPDIYVQLKRGGVSLNVRLNDIVESITSIKKVLTNLV